MILAEVVVAGYIDFKLKKKEEHIFESLISGFFAVNESVSVSGQ